MVDLESRPASKAAAEDSARESRAGEQRLRAMRAAVANVRAAAETLDAYPEMEIVRRTRLLAVLVEETGRLAAALAELETELGDATPTGGPASVGDLVAALESAISATGARLEVEAEDVRLADLQVGASPRQLADELAALVRGLRAELGISRLHLGVSAIERHLRLDLGWAIAAGAAETTSSWILDALAGQPLASGESCTLRELVRRLGGEVWFTLDRAGGDGHLRLLLSTSSSPGGD